MAQRVVPPGPMSNVCTSHAPLPFAIHSGKIIVILPGVPHCKLWNCCNVPGFTESHGCGSLQANPHCPEGRTFHQRPMFYPCANWVSLVLILANPRRFFSVEHAAQSAVRRISRMNWQLIALKPWKQSEVGLWNRPVVVYRVGTGFHTFSGSSLDLVIQST